MQAAGVKSEGEEPRTPEIPAPAEKPARIGKYDVRSEVGKGTLVKLYRATDQDTGRAVLLKVLTGSRDRRLVELFRRVVAAAARLRHRNLITIYELGEHAGMPFAAMQDLDGRELRAGMGRESTLSLLQKVSIMVQIAEGLQAAHQGGLPYVGVRPSGIFLTDEGSAVIHDFSIVRLISEEQDEDVSYAAPEELKAGALPDQLCDVFSFGTIFYELLAGSHPFRQAMPIPLRKAAADCPEALEHLVHRAFEQERERRYQSMDELLDDAEPILCEMKRARAASLLAEARRLQRSGQIGQAQSVAREVMELDPASRAARELHTGLRAEQQRRIVQERLRTLFKEADEEAGARRFARAVDILNSAVKLDASSTDAAERLEEMCGRLERSQNAAQLLMEARQSLAEASPEEARTKAAEARSLDPDRPETDDLLRAIAEAIERRRREAERQFRLERELEDARSLLAGQRFAEVVARLTPIEQEFPADAALRELLEQARHAIQQAAQVTASTRQALDEAQWLLDQDRPHLAARFLREKCAELHQPELDERLAAIEGMIPDWENRRFVQDSISRAAAMEQSEQWAVALTLVEQALETAPGSPELTAMAERLRLRRGEEEGRRKLGRRLEAIQQKIEVGAWTEAISLIEAAQTELPDEPELARRLEEAHAGRRRAECDTLAVEVRQCLNDRAPEKAEELLRKGMESWPNEPALESLWEELQAGKRYRDQCRAAQLLFSRRQFHEAEEILAPLAAESRPEAQALLDAVRAAKAATEEHDFYDHTREQALKLIVQRQFAQAADLIRNLINLFPGDPMLQRDLQMAEAGLVRTDAQEPEPTPQPVAAAPIEEPATPMPQATSYSPKMESLSSRGILPYVLWPALGASVIVFVLTSGGTIWNLFHRGAEAAATASVQPTPQPQVAPPASAPIPPVAPPPFLEPKPISQPAPTMPPAAVQRGIHGPVMLEATVSPKGTIMQIKTLSGHPILADAARSAVWKWRYEPGRRNGRVTAVKVQIRLFEETGQ